MSLPLAFSKMLSHLTCSPLALCSGKVKRIFSNGAELASKLMRIDWTTSTDSMPACDPNSPLQVCAREMHFLMHCRNSALSALLADVRQLFDER